MWLPTIGLVFTWAPWLFPCLTRRNELLCLHYVMCLVCSWTNFIKCFPIINISWLTNHWLRPLVIWGNVMNVFFFFSFEITLLHKICRGFNAIIFYFLLVTMEFYSCFYDIKLKWQINSVELNLLIFGWKFVFY